MKNDSVERLEFMQKLVERIASDSFLLKGRPKNDGNSEVRNDPTGG